MQNDQLPRQRVPRASSIVETLHAFERGSDRIDIVTVGRERRTGKTSFDALHVAGRPNKPVFTMLDQRRIGS